ncbi:Flavin-dependent oxidoreductase, luciferase family (includes alkanesulfonate monooxygenase SsuD and methylene tetrahydromethanopterin reductase) [Nakamurella panacisegetis]|uniref:Flavin-dependent oxidoreductase, luciferase family (Includes alkanesulfonate monooxygenase SsuD and methylene tetrahydromethanopterin reductase) n=1 Tax=Nakamurella panacisegetis TaxID=1090615 RepID=A0A1H0NIY6_9ACTN|nr:LLM class flavin-dependent oxidoreductase [Nakamurella panacisegetis]SDO92629.1 Flavin-dependent oxidoreductase, luciferase family (includes alkanesulfonate monooxygenase SsuD and methylene tetrahydromethanopterin reductase) [Nakamurella panacisegetis]
MSSPLHLAIALEGAGWHPAAWREPSARPADLFGADYWLDLVALAERGLADFLTIEDSFSLDATGLSTDEDDTNQVRGRLDAVLIADRVAPTTRHIGLVPTVLATHTEPFHISKAIATLDHVSTGRGGVRVQVSARAAEAAHVGRRQLPLITQENYFEPAAQQALSVLLDEATDFVEVIRRLWDSWEDNAEIRDVTTGRFIDRDKIHYIDFQGQFFSVKGPSIVPRPPQGQPLVTALAHSPIVYRFAARSADVVFVTPADTQSARRILDEVRTELRGVGRPEGELAVYADVVVFLDSPTETGEARRARLDALSGAPYVSDAYIFAGSAGDLADLLLAWQSIGYTGFRLRPGTLPDDLTAITEDLVPELQSRGAFRTEYESDTLRGLLGLGRPTNRYAVPAPITGRV